jgi:hypothetical protein
MSERDDRYAGNDLPSTTAEFRATPDMSASTAQFQAFAAGTENVPGQRGPAGSWPEQPWAGEAAASKGSGRTIAIVVGALVIVAIVVAILLIG